jgi:hypothetical protein
MAYGWYGANEVKRPIHAPLTPRLNSANGTTQHDEARIAATTLPPAVAALASRAPFPSAPRRPEGMRSASLRSLAVTLAMSFRSDCIIPKGCSHYRCKRFPLTKP